MPKVSVIMPVYNTKEEYLREAIESILNQTFPDFEFIIINDGSTNNAEDIILSYKDKRIRYIKQKNSGVAKTLNYGFDIAQGKYIARMDSDDISLPFRFEKQVEFLERNKGVSAVCSSIEIFPQVKISKTPKEIKFLDLYFFNCICHPTVMLRRSDFNKHNLRYDPSFTSEDYELWTRVVKVLKFCSLQEVLLKYRIHGENISLKENIFTCSDARIKQNMLDSLTSDIKLQKKIENLMFRYRGTIKKNTFIENIFSIKNAIGREYKILCIFGIKIKIKRR